MSQPVRKPSPTRNVAWTLVGVAGGALCAAQVARWASGEAWEPVLAIASGWIAVSIAGGLWMERRGGSHSELSQTPRAVSATFGFLWWLVSWAAVCVCVVAGLNWWRGTEEPLVGAAIRGSVMGGGTLIMMTAAGRGWIRGILFDPQRSQKLQAKRDELARQREQILATARQNGMN